LPLAKSTVVATVAKGSKGNATTDPAYANNLVTTTDSALSDYTVRRGDNLAKLAEERGVSAAQIMTWNRLRSSNLSIGQKLVFHGANGEDTTVLASSTGGSTLEVAASPSAHPTPRQAKPVAEPASLPKIHLVQPGDTLYNISRRYQGVTVEQLRKLNHLKSDEVKPGQKLVLGQG
jgi:membrane-bound lytic murein transglycosylase D